ncbi:MAG: pyridoxal phosphate-dependent aminotransferase, partial [Acidobacteriota bacterium]
GTLSAMAAPVAARNQVHALGLPAARRAVARDRLAAAGPFKAPLGPEDVVLTASTSEAYSFLFKLLCDPGDQVLVPMPGYPLFQHLAALEGLKTVPYRLHYKAGWQLDLSSVEACVNRRSRVLMIISPHNPTGWILSRRQADEVLELACRHHLAIISDEVFSDFVLAGEADWSSAPATADEAPALPLAATSAAVACFSLGGLSKGAGLPQMKVSWILIGGTKKMRLRSRERLEWIADLYLSPALPQQLALPAWLQAAAGFRERLRRRLCINRSALAGMLRRFPSCRLLDSAGGWSAIMELPAARSDEEHAVALLERHDLLVHPGYFFDLAGHSHIVVSLLLPPPEFARGLERLAAYLRETD